MNMIKITDPNERMAVMPRTFGDPMLGLRVENAIFDFMGMLAPAYQGGMWDFYRVLAGQALHGAPEGFFMAPAMEGETQVVSPNGAQVMVPWDVAGLVACRFAYSHLSIALYEGDEKGSAIVAKQYYAILEVGSVLHEGRYAGVIESLCD